MVFHLPLNVMEDVIQDLESNKNLRVLLGVPVSRHLIVAADEDDIRIELGPGVQLEEDKISLFDFTLKNIVRKHRIRYYGEDE